jgi:hypothetical protein
MNAAATQQLEAAFEAAKKADPAAARAMLPALNAARRQEREAVAAQAAKMAAQGRHPDGHPMTPDEKLFSAIFAARNGA